MHFQQVPGLLERYGEGGKVRCLEDAVYHLEFLIEALKLEHVDMYTNYIVWASAMLRSRNIPMKDLENSFDFMLRIIEELIGEEGYSQVLEYVEGAKEKLEFTPEIPETYILETNPFKREVESYLNLLLNGKRKKASLLIDELLQNNVSVKDIYHYIFQISQYEIGILWQCNKITVAHEHYCTAATQSIMSGLYQTIFSAKRTHKVLVACSISGDLHEMGIRMVADFFEMEGWDTYYLGADVSRLQLMEALTEYKADVLAISVTLPTYVSKTSELITHVRTEPNFQKLKIIVGGYPFMMNPGLWKKVGAQGYGQNAFDAIELVNNLMKA